MTLVTEEMSVPQGYNPHHLSIAAPVGLLTPHTATDRWRAICQACGSTADLQGQTELLFPLFFSPMAGSCQQIASQAIVLMPERSYLDAVFNTFCNIGTDVSL